MRYTCMMTITALESSGNSSKFLVVTKNGQFKLAISFTLRKKIWQLSDTDAELVAAEELAEAIVSRWNPNLAFKDLYILAEHNTLPTLEDTVKQIRTVGYQKQF
jgi:hypothetical protein